MKIMQCWDDSVRNDIRLAELFRQYGAKATFNIIPGGNRWLFEDFPVDKLEVSEMLEVYRGFKVAGHGGVPLTRLPAEQVRRELAAAKQLICDRFEQEQCGYAYPGGGVDDAVKELVREAGFLYARTTRDVDGPLPLDEPMALPAHCHFRNPLFWEKYERVREADGVFYFWGHSYELKDDETRWANMEATLARIAGDSKAEWIDVVDLFA
jgi:peptidoglycan/xylan/chitin deacetylase (PgdA/CDA1 family)